MPDQPHWKRCFVKLCCKIFILIICSYGVIRAKAMPDSLLIPPHSEALITSLNFKDTDIRDVLRSIAYEYEANIVIDNQINQKISVSLFKVRVFDALKIIATDYGLDFKFDQTRFYYKKPVEKEKPVPPEPEPIIEYKNGALTIDLQNVEIGKFIGALSKITGKNFLLAAGTIGKISGNLTNVVLPTALKHLLFNNGYFYQVKDSIYYVSRSAYFSTTEKNAKDSQTPYWVSASGGKVTIDVNQASLEKILNDIALQLGMQIVKLTSPNVNVTLKCNDTPLDKALFYLFRGTEFAYKNDNGVFVIGNKSSKLLDNTKLIKLSYLKADKTKDKIPAAMTQGVILQAMPEHNAIVASGSSEAILGIEDFLKTIDVPVAQVLIEALVVDYNLDNTLQTGLTLGTGDSTAASKPDKWFPGLDVTAGGKKINNMLQGLGTINVFNTDINIGKIAKLPDSFYANLQFMQEKGIANVKSKPILATLNGYTASLKIGTVQNYVFTDILPMTTTTGTSYIQKETIQKVEATISFEITPWVGPNSELTLEIKPDFQTPIGTFSSDKKLIPAINTRALSSTVRLRDGETIILGGLIQESETDSKSGMPYVSDIPWIGSLFTTIAKKKTKEELVIYVTPRISYGDDFGTQYDDLSK